MAVVANPAGWCCLLALAITCAKAMASRIPEERSVPEPTILKTASLAIDAVVASERLGSLGADASTIVVHKVHVTSANESSQRGVLLVLESEESSDEVWLPAALLPQAVAELDHLKESNRLFGRCESPRCIRGIARCRPSQSELQAFCPGMVVTREGSRSLSIRTPRHGFILPDATPDGLARLLEASEIEYDPGEQN